MADIWEVRYIRSILEHNLITCTERLRQAVISEEYLPDFEEDVQNAKQALAYFGELEANRG